MLVRSILRATYLSRSLLVLKILLDHPSDGLSRFGVMDIPNIPLDLRAVLRVEARPDGDVLRSPFHRRNLAVLERDLPDGVLAEASVHLFNDLRLEQRELVHPGGAVHDNGKFFAPHGVRPRVACHHPADRLFPVSENVIFAQTALKPPRLQYFCKRG